MHHSKVSWLINFIIANGLPSLHLYARDINFHSMHNNIIERVVSYVLANYEITVISYNSYLLLVVGIISFSIKRWYAEFILQNSLVTCSYM